MDDSFRKGRALRIKKLIFHSNFFFLLFLSIFFHFSFPHAWEPSNSRSNDLLVSHGIWRNWGGRVAITNINFTRRRNWRISQDCLTGPAPKKLSDNYIYIYIYAINIFASFCCMGVSAPLRPDILGKKRFTNTSCFASRTLPPSALVVITWVMLFWVVKLCFEKGILLLRSFWFAH